MAEVGNSSGACYRLTEQAGLSSLEWLCESRLLQVASLLRLKCSEKILFIYQN
jgi:hypothetical protein